MSPLTALWRSAVIVGLMTGSYAGGQIVSSHSARISELEAWRGDIHALAASRDERIKALERIVDVLLERLASIQASQARMERKLDGLGP